MISKRTLDWIKSERAQGYSDEQLKKSLLESGYDEKEVDEVLGLKQNEFNVSLSQRRKYLIVLLLTIVGILVIGIFPLIQSFNNIKNSLAYIFISVYVLVIGFVSAYFLDKLVDDSKKFLKFNLVLSSVLALVFAFDKFIRFVILRLSGKFSQMNAASGTHLNVFGTEVFDADIAFLLAFLLFNLPVLLFYFRRRDKKMKSFLLYLVPLLIFVVLSFASGIIAKIVLS